VVSKDVFQLCEGGVPPCTMYLETVDWATLNPSISSSPWIRAAHRCEVSLLIRIAAIDLYMVPTLTFEQLFGFLVLGYGRRQLRWFEVMRHPTAEWLARQIIEAFPWASAPVYLVRDNDRASGHAFTSREGHWYSRPTRLGSPW